MTISCFECSVNLTYFIYFKCFFSFTCFFPFFLVLPFVVVVAVVVIVVMFILTYFFIGCIQEAGEGSPLCDDLKSCDRNSAESDIEQERSLYSSDIIYLVVIN